MLYISKFHSRVEIERFLEIVVMWEHGKNIIKDEEILQAFAFESFEDRTYIVTFDELLSTIRKINPSTYTTDRQILRVYREINENSDGYGVEASKIINTLHKHKLIHWRTLPNPPTLDTKLRVINFVLQNQFNLKQNQVTFDFLDTVWLGEEEMINNIIRSGQLPPKVQQQLQETVEGFQKCMDNRNDPEEALKCHRACIKQWHFAESQI